jgi:NADP-dependent 3-hydroxy acid dehydrogenase YdfG
MSELQDKVAIVSGASSGIGWASAKALAEAGAKVMLTARREERLKKLKEEIDQAGGAAEYVVTDVVSREQVQNSVDKTLDKFGKIDILFNNAGLMPLSLMKNGHVDEWDQMVDVNIKGLLYYIHAILPNMMENNSGHILNVSSVAGHKVFPGGAVYCATKFAVRAISEGLRGELHPRYKIRVTVISPGAVATELTDTITDPEIKEMLGQWDFAPLESEDIARSVMYAVTQPENVDVNEVLIRPLGQGL